MCPTQLFCQTTGFLAQAESVAPIVCFAGMIVPLYVAEEGILCIVCALQQTQYSNTTSNISANNYHFYH